MAAINEGSLVEKTNEISTLMLEPNIGLWDEIDFTDIDASVVSR